MYLRLGSSRLGGLGEVFYHFTLNRLCFVSGFINLLNRSCFQLETRLREDITREDRDAATLCDGESHFQLILGYNLTFLIFSIMRCRTDSTWKCINR